MATISGRITGADKEVVDYATVYLKDTHYAAQTNDKGIYHLHARPGEYTLVVSALGYKQSETRVKVGRGERLKRDFRLEADVKTIDEVTVSSTGVERVRQSAYNAIAIDAREFQNTTMSLSDVLAKAPGVKIRETGGVGSNMQLMLDGFSGSHVKVFIDGVPQEGAGQAFNLNNIPVGVAERIEVYRGVVPVGFGTDAIGGVINVVTKKNRNAGRNSWNVDASYSYGSFNTHKSNLRFTQSFRSGLNYEISAYQN